MGIEEYEENLSEESKNALQSETCQKVRDSMKEKKEVEHFTTEDTVVKEYLKSGYNAEDVAEEDEPGSASDVIEENAESEQEPPESTESKGTSKQDSIPAKQQAEEKLKKELVAAKDKSFAEPIIGYLLKRCQEDEGLAEDVVQEHKTWQKCFDYIYSQAKKQTKGNCAAVRDDVVYEWAEDYYHKDDKAEEEKKAKKAAERKMTKAKENTDKTEWVSASPKKKTPKAPPRPKKNGKEMDGQLDLFAMMGM